MKDLNKIQKEIVDSISKNSRGRLLLAPRTGKTRVMIQIIKRDKPDTILWVTPSAKLAEEDIPGEFTTWGAKRYLKKLTTCTWASLHKMVGHYDLIILDEEQYITENNSVNLLNNKLKGRVLSMTGAATKHNDKIELYEKLSLRVLCDLSINKAVDIGILSNYTIRVVQVNMSNTKDIRAGNKWKHFMTSEKKQYDWLSKIIRQAAYRGDSDIKFKILHRMRAIKNSQTKLKAARYLLSTLEGRMIIFSSTIKQAEALCEHTYHSKTDDKDYRLFQNGDIDRIAMVNTGGVGHTYKKIDHLVMVQADSDKNGFTSQKICRVLLKQKNYKATVWIVCLLDTQDESWVGSALSNFDSSKVKYYKLKNL